VACRLCPRVGLLEWLEEAVELRGRDARAAVGDDELGVRLVGAGRDLDPPAGLVVADRVRDEVGGESLDEEWVAADRGWLECDEQLEAALVVCAKRLV